MRIIAGAARGREIMAPKGLETRPVTDIIRESLFNIWQFDIEGADFLDLFSGSGCMGLEALSRGARRVVMVDAGVEQVKTIRSNLKRTKLDACPHEVVKDDVFRAVGRLGRTHQTFDIVYVDPPFTVDEIFEPVMEALGDGALLNEGGVVAIRTSDRRSLSERFGALAEVRRKRYGSSTVHFYQVVPPQDEQDASGPEQDVEEPVLDGRPADCTGSPGTDDVRG